MSRSICINDFITGLALRATIRSSIEAQQITSPAPSEEKCAVAVIKPEPIPSHVLTHMANAMLDPSLGRTATRLGNEIRIAVLLRALKAAETDGWRLTHIEPVA
jgi:hypothetical protein